MFPTHWEDRTTDGELWRALVHEVAVEELFAASPEHAVLAVVLSTGNQMEFYQHDDVWRVRCAHRDLLRKLGGHCGDCTNLAASCQRCLAEMEYESADEFLKEARPWGIDPLLLALATEDQCDLYEHVARYHDRHGSYEGMPQLDTSVAARLGMWAALSAGQKATAAERAARFRAWLKDGLPPYPADWPEHWDKD